MKLVKVGQYTGEKTFHVSVLTEARKNINGKGYFLTYTIVREGILTRAEANAIAREMTKQLEAELARIS